MRHSVYWKEGRTIAPAPQLAGKVTCDALVIGGGLTGLTAARLLRERGAQVVLLEAAVCGSGATGASSGFITPDSELQVAQLAGRFGDAAAGRIWRAGMEACDEIRALADSLPAFAHRQDADSLYVAVRASGERAIREEHETRLRLGLDSRLCSPEDLHALLAGEGYALGVRYGRTFSIDPFALASGLRARLMEAGVRLHENSAVVALDGGRARTIGGEVSAGSVFVCLERSAPEVGIARRDVDAVLSFLMLSEPLDARVLSRVFPSGPLLVWDTDLLYHYFRPTPDGRILAGGSNLFETFRDAPHRPEVVRTEIRRYLRERLALPREVRFTHWWSGRIGVTKDFLPLAGASPEAQNQWWALCGAGLPWSVVAARTAVACASGGRPWLEPILDPRRAFSEAEVLQPIAGRRATFALSHLLSKKLALPARGIPRRRRILGAALGGAAALLLARLGGRRRARRRR
jgi:gamma-glutamylputrescine oxidase